MLEQKRLSDLEAKFDHVLADCDLLIVPRMTIIDIPDRNALPNFLHHLNKAQRLQSRSSWQAVNRFWLVSAP